jgi:hypothetical protein
MLPSSLKIKKNHTFGTVKVWGFSQRDLLCLKSAQNSRFLHLILVTISRKNVHANKGVLSNYRSENKKMLVIK